MAFPALGLAKIVWAVDVILAMDLPEFAFAAGTGAAQAKAQGWHDLGAAADFPAGGTRRVERAGRAVFVHHGADRWRVFDSRCPHEGTDLPLQALEGDTLVCSRHRWRFDVRTGACTAVGDRPLRERDSRLQEGRLQAYWE
jgi:nitrite reductase/ring-hydroxylating ferredoxin subunit